MKKFKNIVAPKSKAKVRKNNRKGVMTIVCKPGSSRCILIDAQLAETLELEDTVEIGFVKKERKNVLILGKTIPDVASEDFPLRNRNAKEKCIKKVIYNSELVEEIIDFFQLDFSEKISVTLYGLELFEEDGVNYAVVGKEE